MKFRLQMLVAVGAMLLSGCFVVHATTSRSVKSTVSVAGMTIAKVDPASEYGGSMVPGLQPGTTIHVLVNLPGRNIIMVHQGDETQFTISDSSGKDLKPSGSGIGFMSNISDDGQSVRLPITSADLPGKNASAIYIDGLVKLTCGNDSKTDSYEAVIRKDAKMTLAGIEFRVTEVKDSYMNENEEMFELQTNTSPAQIQKMEAVMKNGSVVELRPSGSSRFGFNDSVTYGRTYSVAGKAADITTLKVTFFQSIEELEIPVKVNVGLGF